MDTTTPSSQFGKLGHFARRRPGIVILVVLLVLLCTVVFYGAAAVLFGKWAVGFLPGSDWTRGQFPASVCRENEGCLASFSASFTDFFYFLDSETVIYEAYDRFTIRSFAENKFASWELDHIEYTPHLLGAIISPDRSHLAACFQEYNPEIAEIQIWNIPSRHLLVRETLSNGYCGTIDSMNFSRDNRLLAISYNYNPEDSVEIWDLQRNSKQIVSGKYGAFSPDNQSIIVLSDDRTLSLLSLENFQVKQTFAIPGLDDEHHARYPVFSPDGQWLAVNLGSYNRNDIIDLWHLPDGEFRHQLALPGALRCQSIFSPDSLWLATCTELDFGTADLDSIMSTATAQGVEWSDFYVVSIWKLEDGTLLQKNQFPHPIGGDFPLGSLLNFSPDGAKMGFGVGSSGYVVIDTYYSLKRP